MKAEAVLAQNECANSRSGRCLGTWWDETGAPVLFRKGNPACEPEGCAYLRRCVLPIASRVDGHRKLLAASRAQRLCPGCGDMLVKGKRLCPKCRKEGRRRTWVKEKRRNRKETPEAETAQTIARAALKSGEILAKPCEVCGVEPATMHHEDYRKPLAVTFLCPSHHRKLHVERKPDGLPTEVQNSRLTA